MPEPILPPQESLPASAPAAEETPDVSASASPREAYPQDYEGMFILKPTLDEAGQKKTVSGIEGEISKLGGIVQKSEGWGKRRLGFKIKKEKEGLYHRIMFQMKPASVTLLRKRYQLNEAILKVLFLKEGKK